MDELSVGELTGEESMIEEIPRKFDTEQEKIEFLSTLLPNESDLDPVLFKRGLGASIEEFDQVESYITTAFETGELVNFESLEETKAREILNETTEEIARGLCELFHNATIEWTKMWADALVRHLWRADKEKRADVREGKRSASLKAEGSHNLGKEETRPKIADNENADKLDRTNPVTDSVGGLIRPLTLDQTIFHLKVFGESGEIIGEEELVAERFVPYNPTGAYAKDFIFTTFVVQFDKVVNGSREDNDKISFRYGKFGYIHREKFREVKKQQHFEVALNHLFNSLAEGDDTLRFEYHMESKAEKQNRINAEKAKQRLQAGNPKQPTPPATRKSTPASSRASDHARSSSRSRSRTGVKGDSPTVAQEQPRSNSNKGKGSSLAQTQSRNPEDPLSAATAIPAKASSQPGWTPSSRLIRPSQRPLHRAKAVEDLAKKARDKIDNLDKTRPDVHKDGRISRAARRLSGVFTGEKPIQKIPVVVIPERGSSIEKSEPKSSKSAESSSATRSRRAVSRLSAQDKKGTKKTPRDSSQTSSTSQRKEPLAGIDRNKPKAVVITPIRKKPEPDPNDVSVWSDSTPSPKKTTFQKTIEAAGSKVSSLISGGESASARTSVDVPEAAQTGPKTPSFMPQAESTAPPVTKRRGTFSYPRPARRLSFTIQSRIKNVLGAGKELAGSSKEPDDSHHAQSERFASLFEISKMNVYKRGGDENELQTPRPLGGANEDEAEEDEVSDTDAADEYLFSQLQALQNLEELTQIKGANFRHWEECCRMFQIDPRKTGFSDTIQLHGLKTKLHQYQAFGVYWQMKRSRVLGGGFVADEMGLGKTLIFLAYLVAERQLVKLWDEVNISRTLKDGRHLRQEEQHVNDHCPNQDSTKFWLSCPCAQSSPTSTMRPKTGVRLACVPASLVVSWKEQWLTHIDERAAYLFMSLIIAHPPSNPVLPRGFDNRDARHPRNASILKAVRHSIDVRSNKFVDDTPAKDQDRYLVLTTRDHYKPWIKQFEYEATIQSFSKSETGTWVKGKNRGIVFGIALIDECHEEYLKGKGRSGVLSDLPTAGQPFLWGYSGTPFSQTPRALEGVLWAIESHFPKIQKTAKETGWETDKFFYRYNHKILDEICKEFEKHVKNGSGNKEETHELLQRFKPFVTTFIIRRTAETSWFGRPLIKLKPHTHADFILKHNPKFDSDIALLGNVIQIETDLKLAQLQSVWERTEPDQRSAKRPTKLAVNTLCRVQWRQRIIATFPYLVKLAAADHPQHLDLTTEECLRFRGAHERATTNPYWLHLRSIVESSPKSMWLYRYLRYMDQVEDIDDKEQKIIIMTHFAPVAFILKLFIEKFIEWKRDRVGLIIPGVRPKDRTAIIEAFTDVVDKETGIRKQKQNIKILVGTTRLIGSGLQLTRSCNVILMEPDYDSSRELQAYARVHRIGQRNPMSYSYRLVDEGSEIEKAIIARQRGRGEIQGREKKDHSRGLEQVALEGVPRHEEEANDEMDRIDNEIVGFIDALLGKSKSLGSEPVLDVREVVNISQNPEETKKVPLEKATRKPLKEPPEEQPKEFPKESAKKSQKEQYESHFTEHL